MSQKRAREETRPGGQMPRHVDIRTLRIAVAFGLIVFIGGGIAAAETLLPPVVHDKFARAEISLALFGLAIALLAAVGVYAAKRITPSVQPSLTQASDSTAAGETSQDTESSS